MPVHGAMPTPRARHGGHPGTPGTPGRATRSRMRRLHGGDDLAAARPCFRLCRPRADNIAAFGHPHIATVSSQPGLAKLSATHLKPQERRDRDAEPSTYPGAVFKPLS